VDAVVEPAQRVDVTPGPKEEHRPLEPPVELTAEEHDPRSYRVSAMRALISLRTRVAGNGLSGEKWRALLVIS
jgi:hypothetical protein